MSNTTSLSTVGEQLVALCRAGSYGEAIDTLYADDVVTVEPCDERLEGIEAVRTKNKWWVENFGLHQSDVRGPYPHDDRFAVVFNAEVTHRSSNERNSLDEVGVYTVKDSKIVRAEFFYSTAG